MNTSNTLLGKPDGTPRRRGYRVWIILLILVLVTIAVAGIVIRGIDHAHLASQTDKNATLYVGITKPDAGAQTSDIALPGTVQAFVDAPLYARSDGYLKAWYFDIGARVRKGQLIAVIETPEIDQELEQAAAAVGTARANYELAQVTNRRYQVLVKTNAVSKQEADQSASNEAAQKAALDAAIANEHHYAALQSFQKLYAPFDGIVTERNTDVGQLVSAGIGSGAGSGTGTSGRELFRVAALDRLRTFIPVPQAEAVYMKPGQAADLSFVEHPATKFPGHVARTSNAIDASSRTLLTEVDIDNRNGELFPGAYVTVHMSIPGTGTSGAVKLPANTLIFRSHGMQVAIVGSDGKVHLHDIDIGRDYGNAVEVVNGVSVDDKVVINPPDSLEDGQAVSIAKEPSEGATEAQGGQGPEKRKSSSDNDGGSGSSKGDKQQNTTARTSTSPGAAPEKQSQAPGKSSDQTKGGNQPVTGLTAPGSDGTVQK